MAKVLTFSQNWRFIRRHSKFVRHGPLISRLEFPNDSTDLPTIARLATADVSISECICSNSGAIRGSREESTHMTHRGVMSAGTPPVGLAILARDGSPAIMLCCGNNWTSTNNEICVVCEQWSITIYVLSKSPTFKNTFQFSVTVTLFTIIKYITKLFKRTQSWKFILNG